MCIFKSLINYKGNIYEFYGADHHTEICRILADNLSETMGITAPKPTEIEDNSIKYEVDFEKRLIIEDSIPERRKRDAERSLKSLKKYLAENKEAIINEGLDLGKLFNISIALPIYKEPIFNESKELALIDALILAGIKTENDRKKLEKKRMHIIKALL